MTDNAHLETLESTKKIITVLEKLDVEKQKLVLNTVTQIMGLSVQAGVASNSSGNNFNPTLSTEISPKQFIKEKRPETDVQRVACLAYYLTHSRSQPHFKTADITKLNTEAAYPKFSNAAFAVRNASDQNKFLTQAGKGNKQITAYGEDVVNALPDQNSVKSIAGQKPKNKKRQKKKT